MEFVQIITNTNNHNNKNLKKKFKSNFQTSNKTRLCDSKIRTQDVHNKHEDGSLLC